MRTITILLIGSPSLSRIIEHLVGGRSEYEVVGTVSGLGSLERQAGRLLPELIVANVKPVSIGIPRAVAGWPGRHPRCRICSCARRSCFHQAKRHGYRPKRRHGRRLGWNLLTRKEFLVWICPVGPIAQNREELVP